MKKKFVKVTVDLPIEVIAELAIQAHEADMKLNDFIVKILEEYVDKMMKQQKVSKKQTEHGIIK